jgi:hypothetical protein
MELEDYSNPVAVLKKAKQIFGKDFLLLRSRRKNKKYATIDPNTGKLVNFGQLGSQDWTKHRDPIRRKAFLNRNKRWKDAYEYSPAFLSYHLLW